MRRTFRTWLIVFGLVCAGIALAHLVGGQATYIGGGEVNATMDSDLRFFNILFAAYGLGFVWAAQDIDRHSDLLVLLSGLFFLGGLARFIAWIASGPPTAFYVVMIAVELVVGPAHYLILRRIGQPTDREDTRPLPS
ncbi:MAG: DUF4345 domain-containing protein [Gordonia sp. (in: high G+C Gram-positive bacteria)]